MARQTVITQKRRGPPPTGKGTLIGVRLQPDALRAVDTWAARQHDTPSRPEAIRRLVETSLKMQGERPTAKRASGSAATKLSSEMASETINRLSDKSATMDEQARRRRRLIKGPSEFREMRRQKPKATKD